MRTQREYHVYIMSNDKWVLYIGVTGNLLRRVYEHKTKQIDGFTKKYNLTKLVYFEGGTDVSGALAREKELKKWRREKKMGLIRAANPGWNDLADGWYDLSTTA